MYQTLTQEASIWAAFLLDQVHLTLTKTEQILEQNQYNQLNALNINLKIIFFFLIKTILKRAFGYW